ncbi:nst-1 [Pristionchus pacificus]|uniref:Nst-1 n=1 Tax=Pristionchus pacificus TaxID=54126 RepID=A0A2A6CT38_PRIPA|nr:nst-1 [Pristionchus pacificus]|eukprot:PDM81382.1 nst-1 [Pristionchus pacificus]
MAKLCLKKASKRQSCAKRYKIEKKVKDHNKKQAKLARKDKTKKRAAKQEIKVPNSCPFKEEILQAAEKKREEMVAQKEAAKIIMKQRKADAAKEKAPTTIEQLAAKAEARGLIHEIRVPLMEKGAGLSDKTIKQFAGEVRKTIENADVVIEVLDARDPLGSRDQAVERQIVLAGKRLVLLLNKIDLVPKENVQAWLMYLRGFYPTIAFKASTQEQNSKLGRFTASNIHSASTSKCVGADLVMKLLGNYCRNRNLKTSVRVGVIGFPNVGKSSVINSLKRKRACHVGAMPGITKQMQEVELDKNIRLIDSPGVILASNKDLDPVEIALKNAIRVDSLEDPTVPVLAILRRCSKETLMLHYVIPEFTSPDHFLALVARKLGRLKKGDAPMEGDGMVYDPNVEITLDDDAKEEDGMEVDGEQRVVIQAGKRKQRKDDKGDDTVALPDSLSLEDGNVSLNSAIKKAVKKQKRKTRKTNDRAEKMFNAFGSALLDKDESME